MLILVTFGPLNVFVLTHWCDVGTKLSRVDIKAIRSYQKNATAAAAVVCCVVGVILPRTKTSIHAYKMKYLFVFYYLF